MTRICKLNHRLTTVAQMMSHVPLYRRSPVRMIRLPVVSQ